MLGGDFFAGDGCLVSGGAAFPWSKLVISVGGGVNPCCVCFVEGAAFPWSESIGMYMLGDDGCASGGYSNSSTASFLGVNWWAV